MRRVRLQPAPPAPGPHDVGGLLERPAIVPATRAIAQRTAGRRKFGAFAEVVAAKGEGRKRRREVIVRAVMAEVSSVHLAPGQELPQI